ncbi:glutaredoxin-like protein NrdH [Periweissella fabaria]|uniref:Glutaredoxin-like protein NrdH n=2 Tax=Periweissella TaxID=2930384 RepID=A0A7X6N2Z4_9LACO|nr:MULTISPECIES: glutaredoxin-like protein NrdH [Periweissella]MCM0597979.1 glutaredoxin-like protein NrdH [Periweissella fabaria]MCM0598239.1 glutaredoxin-like protein NrdH [Periweissella fabalis]NKZ24826.1 glutaredoxin-like protein NrdH [Periweissella fabalis]CAH0417420.1 Glutaredoxin-like protein NrdH [Periweissella fabaria]
MNKLTVFTKDNCIQCKMTKRFLEARGIAFEEKNVSTNPEYVDYLKAQGFQSVPVVEGANIDSIAGFRPDALQQLA